MQQSGCWVFILLFINSYIKHFATFFIEYRYDGKFNWYAAFWHVYTAIVFGCFQRQNWEKESGHYILFVDDYRNIFGRDYSEFYSVFISIFIIGAGFSVAEATLSAVLADEFPEKSTRHLNFSQVAFSIGALVGPFISAGLINNGLFFKDLYICCTVIFVILGVIFMASVK